MSEWLKEHAWKACVGETLPWVRIPLSPPTSRSEVGGSSGLQAPTDSLRSSLSARIPAILSVAGGTHAALDPSDIGDDSDGAARLEHGDRPGIPRAREAAGAVGRVPQGRHPRR